MNKETNQLFADYKAEYKRVNNRDIKIIQRGSWIHLEHLKGMPLRKFELKSALAVLKTRESFQN